MATYWPEKYYSCSHVGSCLLGTTSIWPALIFVSNSADGGVQLHGEVRIRTSPAHNLG